MKIIAGKYRGLKLDVTNQDIRPTKSVVKEAIFNILAHSYGTYLNDGIVLDLFCGSGALGFEALSRGAKKVIMVDKDTSNAEWNLKQLSHSINVSDVEIIRSDVLKLRPHDNKCDIIILDPPYCNTGVINKIFCRLLKQCWILDDTIIVAEMNLRDEVNNMDSKFNVIESRCYGLSKVIFFNYGG